MAMAKPKFKSNELVNMPDSKGILPRPFKYDLNLIYPDSCNERNKVLMLETMYFYQAKEHKLIKNLLILNRHGIFSYGNIHDFLREPRKP